MLRGRKEAIGLLTRTGHRRSRDGVDDINPSNPGRSNILARRIHTHAVAEVREHRALIANVDRTNRQHVRALRRERWRAVARHLVLVPGSNTEVDPRRARPLDCEIHGGRPCDRPK